MNSMVERERLLNNNFLSRFRIKSDGKIWRDEKAEKD